MAEEKKKGIFEKAVDAISGRDEKEDIKNLESELERAKKEAEAAKKALKSTMNEKHDSIKERTEAEQAAQKAEKRIEELENKLKDNMAKERERAVEKRQQDYEDRRAAREEAQKPDIIATHTVTEGQTLSHVALRYYKHATPPYWKYLLEHNKEILEGNERNIRMGMKLEIPELPDDLKD